MDRACYWWDDHFFSYVYVLFLDNYMYISVIYKKYISIKIRIWDSSDAVTNDFLISVF